MAGLLPQLDPHRVEEVVLSTARALWRAGPHRQLCSDLGIAAWEGLWATFEGGHPSHRRPAGLGPPLPLDGLARRPVTLGIDDDAMAEALAARYVEGNAAATALDGADRPGPLLAR